MHKLVSENEDIILTPEDYTGRDWDLICKIFGGDRRTTSEVIIPKGTAVIGTVPVISKTYGEIYNEFRDICGDEIAKKLTDFRPAINEYFDPKDLHNGAVLMWLNDGSRIIYITNNVKKVKED